MKGSGKIISLAFKIIAGIFLMMSTCYFLIYKNLTWEIALSLVLISIGIANIAFPVDVNKTILNLKGRNKNND
jgi:hypothetical protein